VSDEVRASARALHWRGSRPPTSHRQHGEEGSSGPGICSVRSRPARGQLKASRRSLPSLSPANGCTVEEQGENQQAARISVPLGKPWSRAREGTRACVLRNSIHRRQINGGARLGMWGRSRLETTRRIHGGHRPADVGDSIGAGRELQRLFSLTFFVALWGARQTSQTLISRLDLLWPCISLLAASLASRRTPSVPPRWTLAGSRVTPPRTLRDDGHARRASQLERNVLTRAARA
jgi:hypothetical protein